MADAEDIISDLEKRAGPIDALHAEVRSGLYASRLARGAAVPQIAADGMLYVGRSDNLAQRDFDSQFASGKTGFSTLRRSLGALLKDQLALRAIRRGPGASLTNVRNYRFDQAGEQRLTEWMTENLLIAATSHPDPKKIERAVIAFAGPALNLTGWDNPARAKIKRLRKLCADQAAAKES